MFRRRHARRRHVAIRFPADKPTGVLTFSGRASVKSITGTVLDQRCQLIHARVRGVQSRRTTLFATGMRCQSDERTLVQDEQLPPAQARQRALRHAQSVAAMLAAERSLLAWAPQLKVKTRRANYPRRSGRPVARRWLTFNEKRMRRQLNAKLLDRSIPQRRYVDYVPTKLQFYYGSVGGRGYTRVRRSYRAHTDERR